MTGRKRKAPTETERVCSDAAVNAATAASSLVHAVTQLKPHERQSNAWRRKLAADELFEFARVLTPYGLVCHDRTLNGENVRFTTSTLFYLFSTLHFNVLYCSSNSS